MVEVGNSVGVTVRVGQDHVMDPTALDTVELREAGLLVRPWHAGDADAVFRACQDPLIPRWTGMPQPYLREHAESFVGPFTTQSWANGTAAPMGVFDAGTGEMLGASGLISLSRDRSAAEVGYWVAPWARGRGVATDATRAVARWALDTLGVLRLAWRAELGNHASRLVAERLGFRLEGIVRNGSVRAGGIRVDAWGASLVPGELREADAPADPVATRRAHTFGRAQPTLSANNPRRTAISLRPLASGDLDAIVRACRDAETARWTTVPDPYTPADAEFFVHVYGPRRWAAGEGGAFAIVGPDDAYAGSMELRITAPRTGSVGYLVAPWARGRGYASAALSMLCVWGFEVLGLDRIEWQAFVGNEASRRVAEKTGFTIEGVARAACVQRGVYRDAWNGAMLATDPRPLVSHATTGPGATEKATERAKEKKGKRAINDERTEEQAGRPQSAATHERRASEVRATDVRTTEGVG
jgi:RimJ/RimL family protein N-acetyltransferase